MQSRRYRMQRGERNVISHPSPVIEDGVPPETEVIFTAPLVASTIGDNMTGSAVAHNSIVRYTGQHAYAHLAGAVGRNSLVQINNGSLYIAGRVRRGATVERSSGAELRYKSASPMAKFVIRQFVDPQEFEEPEDEYGPAVWEREGDGQLPPVITDEARISPLAQDLLDHLGYIPDHLADGALGNHFKNL